MQQRLQNPSLFHQKIVFRFSPLIFVYLYRLQILIKMKSLNIGDLTVKLPIIQGGMGIGISMSKLASAVANEGGVGVIAAVGIGMFEKDYARDFIVANIRAFKREI